MSISGGSAASSMIQLSALRINRNSPSPGQWTLVREYNIEKRDPYSVRRKPELLMLSNNYFLLLYTGMDIQREQSTLEVKTAVGMRLHVHHIKFISAL